MNRRAFVLAGSAMMTFTRVKAEPPAPPPLDDAIRVPVLSDPRLQARAFADAFSEALRAGHGNVELEGGATYYVRVDDNEPNGSRDRPKGCVVPPSGTMLSAPYGNPATIAYAGWKGETGMHNRSVVLLDNVSDVTIDGVNIGGAKFSTTMAALDTIPYKQAGDNGGLHGIAVRGGDGIALVDMRVSHCLTDGISVDEHADTKTPTTGLLVSRCDFTNNRRQAMSIIKAGLPTEDGTQLRFVRTKFRKTGDEGSIRGQAPASNVDIEPNGASDTIFGVEFYDCDFDDAWGASYNNGKVLGGLSAGRGLALDLRPGMTLTSLKVVNCRFSGNRGDAIYCTTRGANWSGCLIDGIIATDNGGNGVVIENHLHKTGEPESLLDTVTIRRAPEVLIRQVRGKSCRIIDCGKVNVPAEGFTVTGA